MKTYEVAIQFLEGLWAYKFTETDRKNPNNEVLFEGVPIKRIAKNTAFNTSKGNMYILHYTEKYLRILSAEEINQILEEV